MKGEVPRCEPGVFPLVRHRHDIGDHKVAPIAVAPALPVLRGRRLTRIPVEPMLHVEIIKLLVPQHSGKGLTLYPSHVLVGDASLQGSIKDVRLANAPRENIIEAVKAARPVPTVGEPQPDRGAATGRDLPQVKSSNLGAFPGRVHRFSFVVENVFVKGILEVAWPSIDAEQSVEIGFVVAEQQAVRVLEANAKFAKLSMPSKNDAVALILQ